MGHRIRRPAGLRYDQRTVGAVEVLAAMAGTGGGDPEDLSGSSWLRESQNLPGDRQRLGQVADARLLHGAAYDAEHLAAVHLRPRAGTLRFYCPPPFPAMFGPPAKLGRSP